MGQVSREQIDRAKQIGILDYILRHESNNCKRIGKAYYLKDHDSLRISNNLWKWESRDIGGKTAVDFLIKVRGYSFVDAVTLLSGEDIPRNAVVIEREAEPAQKPELKLPSRNAGSERVIAYLQGRGIEKHIIVDCINRGVLYESSRWHDCVFIGRDNSGKARYAFIRGTSGDFKRDASGSDKRFGFLLTPANPFSDTVAVFESPIDVLSYQTIYQDGSCWQLSLGCTSLAALMNFMETQRHVKRIIVCTDDDSAGNRAADKIKELEDVTVVRSAPPIGKDWNDTLQSVRQKPPVLRQLEIAKAAAEKHNSQIVAQQESITQDWR